VMLYNITIIDRKYPPTRIVAQNIILSKIHSYKLLFGALPNGEGKRKFKIASYLGDQKPIPDSSQRQDAKSMGRSSFCRLDRRTISCLLVGFLLLLHCTLPCPIDGYEYNLTVDPCPLHLYPYLKKNIKHSRFMIHDRGFKEWYLDISIKKKTLSLNIFDSLK